MDSQLSVKTIPFMGDELMAAKDEHSGKIYAGVSYICKGIGLTEKQKDNEVSKIQKDLVLQKGAKKLSLKFRGQAREVQCIENDFVPLWLAKITITPNMQKDQPEVADKLVQYQLRAKDALAAAFIQKPKSMTAMEMLRLQTKAMTELDDRVSTVEDKLENQMTIDHGKQRTIQNLVSSRVYKRIEENVKIGYENNIQQCRPLYFQSLYHDLKNRFGVASYRDIKVSQYDDAVKYIESWIEPASLRDKAS